jgi:hypothetical protein
MIISAIRSIQTRKGSMEVLFKATANVQYFLKNSLLEIHVFGASERHLAFGVRTFLPLLLQYLARTMVEYCSVEWLCNVHQTFVS